MRVAGENGQWGNLPPHLRDEMLQQAQMTATTNYKRRIEDYYRMLGAKDE